MAERTIGVGIVGIGWVAHAHIDAWQANPHSEVVAVCSRSEENARAAVIRHNLTNCRVYTDYEQMLRQENLDLVDICTVNSLHAPQAIAAAQAGKHVLIEKPMAMTLEELRAVEAAIVKAGVKSLCGFVLHWNPYFEIVKSLIANDVLGKIFYVETGYISGNWHKWYPGWHWAKTKREGGDALLVAGAHALDALRYFAPAEVEEVMCYAGNYTGMHDYDPTQVLLMRLADGSIGHLTTIVEGNVPYTFPVRLHGTKGTLVGNRFYAELLDGQTGWAEVPTIMPDTPEVTHHPFRGEMNHLIDCILEDKVPLPDVHDAVKTHEIIFAAQISNAERRPVRLPLPR
jgi:predicted dehydrogenase